MFNQKDIRLLNDSYFTRIRTEEYFIEIKSKNTKHCWLIKKIPGSVHLYHKHKITNPYYHKHRTVFNVSSAISEIKSHDEYVIKKSSRY